MFSSRMMFAPFPDVVTLDLVDSLVSHYGWGFVRGSELAGLFNFWIGRARESGLTDQLASKYILGKARGAEEPTESNVIG